MTSGRAARLAVLAVVGIVLLALTLRIAVASLSPVVDRIGADFPLPAAVVGLIGMTPPLAFAVFAIATPAIERRVGLERLVLISAALAAVALLGRAFAFDAVSLLVATAAVFAAVGVANVLLPAVVKKYFPARIGSMTALYTTTMAVATFVPPLVAVPLADGIGWRTSFLVWAGVAAASIVPWIALAVHARVTRLDRVEQPRASVMRRLARTPLAWALVATFAVNSSVAYASFAWLPVILVDRAGTDAVGAGALLSLFAFIGLPCSVVVPLLAARFRRVWPFYAVAIVAGLTGVIGLLVAPTVAPAVWVSLLGVTPLLFPLMLVLFGLRSRSHDTAVALSGFVQSAGYAFAALVPLAIGVTHELTGGWTTGLVLLAAVVALAIPAGVIVSRGGSIEEAWERRTGKPW